MLKRLLTQARRLQLIADWLDLRQAKRESQALDDRYKSRLAEAKKRDARRDELDAIQFQYHDDLQIIWDPIHARRSTKLVARARKYGVQVPPMPGGYQSDDNWYLSSATADWFLSNTAEEHLKREIRAEKRQSDDEIRKWATLGISIAAFVLALVSLTAKQKQPDPCPKNYYRSDSGECIFARQKAAPSQPQQGIPPIPSMQPTKPSPTKPKP